MDIVITAIFLLIRFVEFMILARIILSWIKVSSESKIVIFIYQITEPILQPIRNLLQKTKFGQNAMFDFAPLAAYLLLMVLRIFISMLFGGQAA